jgi:hypothetical protein
LVYRPVRHTADQIMVQSIHTTTFNPEAAAAARMPYAVDHLGSRRPNGAASVFARRRAS